MGNNFFTKTYSIKLILALIFSLALFLRTFHLAELSHFNYDEARDAIAEKSILEGHFTMLGPEVPFGNKEMYFGPLHYYLMAPALKLFNFDPLGTYFWTAFLGAATTVIIYFATKSRLAAVFYAVFPLAVIYNRWAWNPNTIPFFGALCLLALVKKKYFFFGLFLGFAFQLHILAVFLGGALLLFLSRKSIIFSLAGFLVGISPMIIFDLRHGGFYFQHLLDIFNSGQAVFSHRGIEPHYFLWSIPLMALLISKIPKFWAVFIIAVSLSVTVYWLLSQKAETIKTPFSQRQIAQIIAGEEKGSNLNFNVAAFIAGEARATPLRYFLSLEKVNPLGIAEYSVADHLYVVTFEDKQNVLYNQTYEIASFVPTRVSQNWQISGANLYRLEKN